MREHSVPDVVNSRLLDIPRVILTRSAPNAVLLHDAETLLSILVEELYCFLDPSEFDHIPIAIVGGVVEVDYAVLETLRVVEDLCSFRMWSMMPRRSCCCRSRGNQQPRSVLPR